MKLSLRSKQEFYHQLGQLLKAGVAFPKALETLERSGTSSRLLQPLRQALSKGKTIGEAFAGQPLLTAMESSVFASSERSGRLEYACDYLSAYFEKLDRMRSEMLRKTAYPIFLLHFGVLILPVSEIFKNGMDAYLHSTVGFLVQLYLIGGAAWLLGASLKNAGTTVNWVDRLLRQIPVLGQLRRTFASNRFCATYDLQLEAGVNIMESLQSAAKASQSACVLEAVQSILPEIRAGNQVGPLLAASGAFPSGMTRVFCIAEEIGGLDKELKRLCAGYEEAIRARMETLANWIPKLIYIGVTLYLAYQILSTATGAASEFNKALEF